MLQERARLHIFSLRQRSSLRLLLVCFILCTLSVFPTHQVFGDESPFAGSGKWIALIIEYTSSDYNQRLIEGVREEAEKVGLRLEVLDAKGNKEFMPSMIDDVTLRNVDGILISHGLSRHLQPSVFRSVRKGVPVVSIHNDLDMDGVTMLGQDDRHIQRMLMERMIEDTGGEADFVLIWIGGFVPMDLRMEVYEEMLPNNPGLKELARFGVAGVGTDMRTEFQMKEVLDLYPQGTIDAVIATWDEYAKGAARAIMAKKRSEIRLYGIDISESVLQMIQDPDNPWQATVCVDSKALGKTQVRMVAHAMLGGALPKKYVLQPVLVTKSMLPKHKAITMADLGNYVPGWDTSGFAPGGEVRADSGKVESD